MAEVPEVETIVRDLREYVLGRMILTAEVVQSDALRFPGPSDFVDCMAERQILAADRRAKYILLTLSGDLLLAIHFMLWGTLTLSDSATSRPAETLIVWTLDQDQELRLLDTLGYARAAVAAPDELTERLDLHSLGPEALDPHFSVAVLARQLAKRRSAIKTVLLNQRVLAGLGNRDADESLWLAQIDPQRLPGSLSADELHRLHQAICAVLEEGIALRGTQRDLLGRQGRAKHRRNIFERSGQPCPRCQTPIAYLRLGGRNTHYCPTCQR
jgi:formamidopyrimidine-DNA glycosylase